MVGFFTKEMTRPDTAQVLADLLQAQGWTCTPPGAPPSFCAESRNEEMRRDPLYQLSTMQKRLWY
jgi:hypothetical protein